MSRQPEARLQVRIVKALRAHGIPAWRIRPLGLAGWPDIYAIRDGRAVHLEVKIPGGRATKLQERRLEELSAAGAVVGVVSSVDEALAAVLVRDKSGLREFVIEPARASIRGTVYQWDNDKREWVEVAGG